MKNNHDIHSTDTNEIKHLINRVKQGELDQGDALLIEKLLSILLTIVSLLERKHTSIQRMKELLFGMKEVSFRRAIWIFIISMSRQFAEISRSFFIGYGADSTPGAARRRERVGLFLPLSRSFAADTRSL